ncbi:TonB-dependent receptor plug domain-containing protein [Novosphingobium resinovorum]|uniref:TonB-dependent receptor plug domain-containing protein n=1 Tax=Novosphingobium resinovorum TaxID=158500 RepID=UPI002ED068CC|nr:TonB-dependent receptor plug domain-containing protein [Novosphingobium resinovorum]
MSVHKLFISTSVAALIGYAAPVSAQDAPGDQSAEASVTADAASNTAPAPEIVVTGSRIARSGFDASTPVAVTSSEEIKLSGQPSVERALQDMPQVATSSQGPFSNGLTGAGGGYSDLNLRGFGANRNLVLVYGRRYAIINAASITDTIPASLVERTEIVTGGSSAAYGSDAITGVTNFILKQDFDGITGNAQVNLIPHTSTPTYKFDLTLGKNCANGCGNIIIALNYMDRKTNYRATTTGRNTATSWARAASSPAQAPRRAPARA